jgi:hypothetical protein
VWRCANKHRRPSIEPTSGRAQESRGCAVTRVALVAILGWLNEAGRVKALEGSAHSIEQFVQTRGVFEHSPLNSSPHDIDDALRNFMV